MRNDNLSRQAKITVDGTDFRFEANGRKWWSHKFKAPALRYEVAISIENGDIVWTSGPYPAGRYADLSIFRVGGLKDMLLEANERAEADKGYRGEPLTIELPDDGPVSMYVRKKLARTRHETCNNRFKTWGCLKQRFRHSMDFHGSCFRAVVVMTQLDINDGNSLFDVHY